MNAGFRQSTFEADRLGRLDARRLLSWGLIALLHVGLIYAVNSGLVVHVTRTIPSVIVALMVPDAPKTVEVAKPAPEPRLQTPPLPQIPPPLVLVENAPVPAPAPLVANITSRESAPSVPAPAAIVAPNGQMQPKTISTVEYLQVPNIQYPEASRRKREEGVVQLRVLVNEAGRAVQVDIIKSSDSPRLDEAARRAVMSAIFKPYMENGRPIPVFAMVPIRFQFS